MRWARVLAIHNFVEIFGVAYICRIHVATCRLGAIFTLIFGGRIAVVAALFLAQHCDIFTYLFYTPFDRFLCNIDPPNV